MNNRNEEISMNSDQEVQKTVEAVNAFLYQVSRINHEAAKRVGLTDSEFQMDYYLDPDQALTFSQIVNCSGLPKQTAHSCLKSQMDKGWIAASDNSRSRSRTFFLTEEGFRILHPKIQAFKEIEARVCQSFSCSQRQEFANLLDTFSEKMNLFIEDLNIEDPADQPD